MEIASLCESSIIMGSTGTDDVFGKELFEKEDEEEKDLWDGYWEPAPDFGTEEW